MRDPSPSSLEFALLGLLKTKAQAGYDLLKVFAHTPMRHFSDSPGSVYPALRRLQARKWITAASDDSSSHRRQLLSATATGKRALTQWLLASVTREDVTRGMDPLLLRFAFFDGNVTRKRACKFLADLERELEAHIRELECYASKSGLLKTLNTGGLAFSNGLDVYRAHLSWARSARKNLGEVPTRS